MAEKMEFEQLQSHILKVIKIKDWIESLDACRGHHNPPKLEHNCCYGQMHDGGVILGEYYGMPHALCTPLGYIRLFTNCVVNRSWRPIVKERLGLLPVYGEVRDGEFSSVYSNMGEHGPGWALERDLDGVPFDPPKTEIHGWFMSPSTRGLYEYDEAMELWKKIEGALK